MQGRPKLGSDGSVRDLPPSLVGDGKKRCAGECWVVQRSSIRLVRGMDWGLKKFLDF